MPELRRRAALVNEEHDMAMAEKRERIAAQQQPTLEKEIAVEAERRARATRYRRSTAAMGSRDTWADIASVRGPRDRPRSPSRPAKGWQDQG